MGKWTCCAIIVIFFLAINACASKENISRSFNEHEIIQTRTTVENFCSSEFNGVNSIADIIINDRESYDWKKMKSEGFAVRVSDWDTDPLYIVKSYDVKSVTVKGDNAEAYVTYIVIGKTENSGLRRTLVRVSNLEMDCKISLIKENNKWNILNPPLPKISKPSIINFYNEQLDIMKLSPGEGAYEKKLKKDLLILEGL
jgi:hypothetical protein